MSPAEFLHVAINCQDPLASERFYTRHFAFRRCRVYNPGPGQVVVIKAGNLRLEMFQAAGAAPPFPGGHAGPEYPCWRHIAFAVDDVDAKLAELGADARIDSGPRDTQPFPDRPGHKGRVCWIRDPDGNIIELNQGYCDEANPPPLPEPAAEVTPR